MITQSVKSAAVTALAVAMFCAANAWATTIDPSNYDHNMSISPASGRITSTLSNFPLLLRLSTARQPLFDPADCGTGGSDLRFALADGTLLAHEIDTWNPSGESLVWVNIPSLSADTEIVAYWGVKDSSLAPAVTASDTWSDYVAVYHLGEGDKIAYDSSANGYSATNAAAVSLGSSPKVGGCANIHDLYVTGVTNLLDPNAVKPLSNRSSITFSAWVAIDNFNTGVNDDAQNARVEIARKFNGVAADRHKGGFSCRYFANLSYPPKNNNPVFGIFLDDSTGISSTIENWNTYNAPPSDGAWLYLTCTINGTTVAKYINGALLTDSDGKGNPRNLSHGILGPDVLPLEFGAADKTAPCQTYARMDEMRIRDGAVSAEWAAADYAQQTDASFLVYGEPPDKTFGVAPIPEQVVSSFAELHAGVEPTVTVSNLVAGVELVLNTHYAVAYSNNTACGTAYAIVTGRGDYAAYTNIAPFVISGVTEYFIVGGGGSDAINTSSISGENGATGWSTTRGGARSVNGITIGNTYYYIWMNRSVRSPTNKSYATPSTTTIVIEPSCAWTILDKLINDTLTLSNLVIRAGGRLVVSPVSDGNQPIVNTYAGNYTLEEGASVTIPAATTTDNTVKTFVLSADVSGRGAIAMPSSTNPYSYSGTLANKITGDISGFTGDLKTWNGYNAVSLELVNAASIPGDPAPGQVAYVVVTNSATLKIDQNWVSPTNRIWILGDSGRPTIEVASGKTVEIDADLVGTVGFVKTGAGTLTLRGASEGFTGEITISAGALRLAGQAMRLDGAPGVTITEAGGSLDISGFSVTPIPAQTVYSLEDLAAGVEPTVVVSNLDDGVELVLGTHYTVAYSNNTAYGIATAVVTGINDYEGTVNEVTYVIHAVNMITASTNLTGDVDWTGFESISVVSAGVTLDLKGHKLTVTGLDGAGHITDSVGGGELIFDVPAAYASGYAAKIDTVDLRGQLKLVKTGPGLLICSKSGQGYTGGTDILGGILRTADSTSGKTMDVFSPLGPNTSSAHNQVYLGPNGILDPASTAGWAYHDLTIDGGMISNTVANTQLPGIARCFNPCFTVNADFTFATTEQYGWQIGELNGHTVTVSIAPNKVLYLLSAATPPTSGRLNIVSGGKIGTLSSYPPNFSPVDFVDCNAALTLVGAMSVHDYKPCNTETAGGGSAALSVYGTFTPDSDYFYGPVMQNGSAIDLSAKTGAWSVTSSLTSGNKTTTFDSGATIKLELGQRDFAKGEKVISWTTQPDATFCCKEWTLESRSNGLYVVARRSGSVYYLR